MRVNSLGAKLRSSDLALAQITAKWRGALATFQTAQARFAKTGFDLDLSIHLKNLIAFATGQSRFLTVGALRLDQLQDAWKLSVPAMEFAINFLRSNVGIDSPALLASPFLIITLASYGHHRGFNLQPGESEGLRRWVLLANVKGRYSRGSSETLLDQDLAILRTGGGVDGLLDRLRTQVGRLDISPEELDGRNQRSALFKTMFLAFRAAGATDWKSQLAISLDHNGATHRLQFHHIFPKAVLRAGYSAREADDIANLAFIGGRTNRQISDKAPAVYFPGIQATAGASAFSTQCIPTEAEVLVVEGYRAFLAARRRMITVRLNEYLGMAAG